MEQLLRDFTRHSCLFTRQRNSGPGKSAKADL